MRPNTESVEALGLLSKDGAVLLIIDIQEKLFPHIHKKEEVSKNVRRLIKFMKIVGIPIVLTEQYPKGLGRTIREIKELIPEVKPIEKVEFSCLGSEEFRGVLKRLDAKTLILTGIETHICVSQTAIEALDMGYGVHVVSDATSSRREEDRTVGIERMRQSGAVISSTEMLIYEVLRRAGTKEFKEALRLVK